ncbi:hypothetical protein QX201_007919 [Fusarium graminearum]
MTPKSKRVTAEHTRDRVRNNQRRHRARRRDHIATLEERLHEAEQTISKLRVQVDDLEDALRGNNRRISTAIIAGPEGLGIQEAPAVVDGYDLLLPSTGILAEDHDFGEINVLGLNDLPGINTESTDLALSIFQPAMFSSFFQPGYPFGYQSNQNNSPLQQNRSETTAKTCCSSSNPTPSNLPSPIGTELTAELTRLCCEAYILIAQHNATIVRDETDVRQNTVSLPQLISCNFKMSCCLVKAELLGPQVSTSISYIHCDS